MILVTGGAGYIGSHTVLALLQEGNDVVVIDNLCNSAMKSLQRVAKITQAQWIDSTDDRQPLIKSQPSMEGRSTLLFVRGDVRNRAILDALFARCPITAVIHFAGLKAVGESSQIPLDYYDNNIGSTLTLCQAMAAAGVFRLVFSSSATVYGDPAQVPIRESSPIGALGGLTNPYGRTKLIIEEILRDLALSDARWSIALLRYFNPVGAYESGEIGEDPHGIPNNLLPFIAQVAVGKLKELAIFGNDYPTLDGTGVRDYIHVMDLAEGHLGALRYINNHGAGVNVWNLGTGQGYSVLEILRAFEKVSGRTIPYRFAPRRAGDVAQCFADPAKAQAELGWRAKRGLETMLHSAWHWQSQNPQGYR